MCRTSRSRLNPVNDAWKIAGPRTTSWLEPAGDALGPQATWPSDAALKAMQYLLQRAIAESICASREILEPSYVAKMTAEAGRAQTVSTQVPVGVPLSTPIIGSDILVSSLGLAKAPVLSAKEPSRRSPSEARVAAVAIVATVALAPMAGVPRTGPIEKVEAIKEIDVVRRPVAGRGSAAMRRPLAVIRPTSWSLLRMAAVAAVLSTSIIQARDDHPGSLQPTAQGHVATDVSAEARAGARLPGRAEVPSAIPENPPLKAAQHTLRRHKGKARRRQTLTPGLEVG